MSSELSVVPFQQVRPARRYNLPLYPASWYLFGESRAISHRPTVVTMFGRELVAFRTDAGGAGRVVVLDARCSHAGANLGNGRVAGDTIQCPFHGWRYGADGRCVGIPSGCAIPEFARQRSYAVEERHGYVFVFNGAVPSFPLPWFDDVEPDDVAASRPFAFTAPTPWPSVTGHAFDLQHFLHVHDRRLVEPPVIDTPAPHVRRIRYRAEVVPRNLRDRMLSLAGGRVVSASLVIWGGTFSVITARFERFTSRFMMIMRPIDRRETLCQGIVFGARAWRLSLPIRRYLTRAYLLEESLSLGSASYAPERFVESDRPLLDYFEFLEGISEALEMQGEML
jgi:nitrite reductase/ring-hydroxylating ferredoxin subunit